MNIIFIGSSGVLSLTPLAVLLSSSHSVCAIATNEVNNNAFSAITKGTLQDFSFNHSIPLINLNDSVSSVVSQIEKIQSDVILVSCYDKLIPESIFSLAKKGAFNLHPSLLPRFRGPTPLFWQFREGLSVFGVTLHRIDPEFDTGNIVAAKKVTMDDGVSIHESIKLIAEVGSQLILDFLDDLNDHNINDIAQDNSVSSYQSFPTLDDYKVDMSWAAKRIYNFISAYKEPNVFFICNIDEKEYQLVDALSYQAKVYAVMGDENYLVKEDIIIFACDEGYIKCKLKPIN